MEKSVCCTDISKTTDSIWRCRISKWAFYLIEHFKLLCTTHFYLSKLEKYFIFKIVYYYFSKNEYKFREIYHLNYGQRN